MRKWFLVVGVGLLLLWGGAAQAGNLKYIHKRVPAYELPNLPRLPDVPEVPTREIKKEERTIDFRLLGMDLQYRSGQGVKYQRMLGVGSRQMLFTVRGSKLPRKHYGVSFTVDF